MRRMFAFVGTSLDGCYAGLDGGIEWQHVDEEFNRFSVEQLDEVGTLVFGRVTYEGMAAYWPGAEGEAYDPEIAARMNGVEKIVVSTKLRHAEWSNTRVVARDVAGEVARVKGAAGKSVAVFGSGALVRSLLGEGLLDELRILVNPVVLGEGLPLFGRQRVPLRLVGTRPFGYGGVLLTYGVG